MKKNYKDNPYAEQRLVILVKLIQVRKVIMHWIELCYLIMTIETRLHEGEMVLTEQEANQYRSRKNGGNINIAKLADTIVIKKN